MPIAYRKKIVRVRVCSVKLVLGLDFDHVPKHVNVNFSTNLPAIVVSTIHNCRDMLLAEKGYVWERRPPNKENFTSF